MPCSRKHCWLLSEKLTNGQEGYFKDPYLLWSVAGNPTLYAWPCRLRMRFTGKWCTAGIDRPPDSSGAGPSGAENAAAAHEEKAALEQLLKNGLPLNLVAAIGTGRIAE